MLLAFSIGLLWGGALLLMFAILAALHWVPASAPDSCVTHGRCYCERNSGGIVAQVSNTWSNLGFVAAGLLVLVTLPAAAAAGADPMEQPSTYAVLYGCVVIFLGPGSMFFHASLKQWGGWLDTLSMILYTGFLFAYDLAGVTGAGDVVFFVVWGGLAVGLGLLTWFVPESGIGDNSTGALCFGGLAVLWVVLQACTLSGLGHIERDLGNGVLLLVAGAAVFALALAIQRLSNDGGPWCRSDSRLQGHAIWHLMTAVVTAIVFLYLRTEIGAR